MLGFEKERYGSLDGLDVSIDRVDIPPFLNSLDIFVETGLKIATDRVANATNIKFFFSLATKNSSLVTKVATRFLYDLDWN